RLNPATVRVKDVANAYLLAKKELLKNGELSPRTWPDYKCAADMLVQRFGKLCLVVDLAPDDFAALRRYMAKKWGKVRLVKMVGYVRSIFKHGYEAGLLEQPMRFGPDFRRPSKMALRLERAKAGPKLFTAKEVKQLLGAAGVQVKAMILLGINCGFGNSDCANLPIKAVNLKTGWVDFPRPKTGMPQRCPLWPQTVTALKKAMAKRP